MGKDVIIACDFNSKKQPSIFWISLQKKNRL